MARKAKVTRKTSEVEVNVDITLDGAGSYDIETGIPFFNHMLAQFAKHGLFDLRIRALGDLQVDHHHTVEDVGIALGEAVSKALGEKSGITRFGDCLLPFDETLVNTAVDLSGRPYFVFNAKELSGKVGDFDAELCEEFFKSFSNTLQCNLHIELKYGGNLHHIIEAMFKSVARSLDGAMALDPRSDDVPSTKGRL
ncbi:MAG: imidazoleglycerol-phosphate dehydratase HisB [Thermodesulfobacteriota bacterium]